MVERSVQPIENSYWVRRGRLLAGEYPGHWDDAKARRKIEALAAAGVNAFVDLTEAGESGLKPYAHMLADGATHRRMAIRDAGVPRTAADMTAILDCIDGHLERGDVVYVHCWGGVGRTGTVVGCWLARHGGSGVDALAELGDLWGECAKSRYRDTPETGEQRGYVLGWGE